MENKKYEYKAKYAKENYEHLNIYAPKGYRASIEKCMAQLDMSMNAFVISAIYEKMARCGLTDEEIGNGEPVKRDPVLIALKVITLWTIALLPRA